MQLATGGLSSPILWQIALGICYDVEDGTICYSGPVAAAEDLHV